MFEAWNLGIRNGGSESSWGEHLREIRAGRKEGETRPPRTKKEETKYPVYLPAWGNEQLYFGSCLPSWAYLAVAGIL